MAANRPERRSIRRQLTDMGLRLTTTVLALLALAVALHEVYNRVASVRATLDTQTRMVAANSTAALVFNNAGEAHEILASLASLPDVQQAALFDLAGQPVAGYVREGQSAPCHTLRGDHPPDTDWDWCGVVAYRTVSLHARPVGLLALEVGLRPAYVQLVLALGFIGLVTVAAMALAAPLWRRLAERLTQPLSELVQVTERVRQEQNYRLRSAASGSMEAAVLANAFNDMMAQLEKRDVQLTEELDQRRRAEVRLNDLAYFDNVTALHNRHYFKERVDVAVESARRTGASCALLYIDLDGFKQVNDTLGHEAGDELLTQVGARLVEVLHGPTGVARLGGDEFAIILDGGVTTEQLEGVAAKLVRALREPYALGARTAWVSASIGGCLFPDQADSREAWLRHADSAMYEAKAAGKNGWRLHQRGLSPEVSRHQQLEQGLRVALGDGQLHLVYQPRVDLASGQIMGLEALLRWHHPELGSVAPDEFIPIAEAIGVIVPMGLWMLREAVQQLTEWRAVVPELHMSVNISARQLADDATLEPICQAMRASGLPLHAVELELTESLLVDRSPTMLARLATLRDAGFGLAIDDFGIGYSSLAYLDSFPITTLKIDRAFVQAMHDTARGKAIARAIIAIGQALRVEVVAEGIETQADADLLLRLGCRRGQGYWYSPPLAAAEVGPRLAHSQREGRWQS